jgi:TonB family protein
MRAYLVSIVLVAITCVVALSALAQQPAPDGSAGVDAQGVRHTWGGGSAKAAPWLSDIAKFVGPAYPDRARRSRQHGSGVFRLQIDPASGKVSGVTVVKSTGVDALDDSAVHALRMWRIKPRRWRELDIPITFGM